MTRWHYGYVFNETIKDTHHFRFEGRLHLSSLQSLPVYDREEGVQTNITHNP